MRRHTRGLGCSPFARHYWGNHCCFLFLRVLRCFSSPGSPPRKISGDSRPSDGWVVPFGNPGINGHLHLHRAYRSLSRPSSPPRAKASTRCPNLLSPFTGHDAQTHTPLLILSAVNKISCRQSCLRRTQFLSQNEKSFFTYSLVSQNVKDLCEERPAMRQGDRRAAPAAPHPVENNGFEPLTPCLQSRCSSQLS